ncbi:hypothetical protein B0J11DRAFT_583168 [Dendryphion nanum]|uniref:Uncharacterized protein n=1 Tax=Dendryphion nanum TaxID=256645 RepID=A0A9P9DF35_9PLEO|nr:hypothetical protein B0J11DRAFT_583168 [Dendryphion nanum]
MPPKRKLKANAKAVPTTPNTSTHSAGIRRTRSSSIKRMSTSVQGARTSRLQPTEPLHMTTRGAAKAASNHTSPAAPSTLGGSSRRSSLNSVVQFDDHSDFEDDRPAKRSRRSTLSGSPPNSMGSFVSQIPAVEQQNSASQAASNASLASNASNASKGITPRKRRASGDSIASSKTVSTHPNGLPTHSRSASDLSETQRPRRKKPRTADPLPDPADAPPDLTDASTPPGSPEPIREVAAVLHNVLPAAANGESIAKAARRLPGRRRQPHSDINVETDLRRQLNIKMGYRSVAKYQKLLLEELSNRTIKGLEEEPDYHKKFPQYQQIMDELDQRRQSRLHQIEAERTLKLEQLTRLRVAETHIQTEQYIHRFEEFREDLLLQCIYRVKQFQRAAKREMGDVTDDEEHIISPTHVDFPAYNADDRLGCKFASRSRAYVETERMLNDDDMRALLDDQRKAFLLENEDLDDSVETLPNGFAKFIGPDRDESIAHFNVAKLVDAAAQVEKTPPPVTIPNDQADALLLLASLSSELPPAQKVEEQPKQEVFSPPPSALLDTPLALQRAASPPPVLPTPPLVASSDIPMIKPITPLPSQEVPTQSTPRQDPASLAVKKDAEPTPAQTPGRVTTHRIMDLLNDEDVPVPNSREAKSSASPSLSNSVLQNNQVQPHIHTSSPRFDARILNQDRPMDQLPAPNGSEIANASNRSPTRNNHFWTNRNLGTTHPPRPENRDSRHPLERIRMMLRAKEERLRQHQMFAQGSPSQNLPSVRPPPPSPPHESRPISTASPPSTAANHREPADISKEPTMSSNRPFGGSPSLQPAPNAPLAPNRQSLFPQPSEPSSGERGSRQSWESDRYINKTSHGQQLPPRPGSQYAASPPQLYPPIVSKEVTSTAPLPHQSPYQQPSVPKVTLPPTNSHPLPPKPPVAAAVQPPKPINFRFAHYDPAPQSGPPAPAPSQHYSPPFPTAQPFPGFNQNGWVAPAGSFQAPPPPPPQNVAEYRPPPPAHQYGGQPILPASTPPTPTWDPQFDPKNNPNIPTGVLGMMQQYAPRPPPQTATQPAPQYYEAQPYHDRPAASNPDEHQPRVMVEVGPKNWAPPPMEERPPPQPRPRRQYRSWHPPGTEFRTYQGPNQPRRRGGGSGGGSSGAPNV